jgi:hypothetical protein
VPKQKIAASGSANLTSLTTKYESGQQPKAVGCAAVPCVKR